MKISILTSDLSRNCLGRTYILAKVLQKRYSVEIIGPMSGNSIWYPVTGDKNITYKYIKFNGEFKNYWQLRQSLKKITGDIIYASKPLMVSFGIGLLKKLANIKPLILDIDDWELGIKKESYIRLSLMQKFKNFISSLQNYSCYWNIFFYEKLIPLADEITVSNSFLQRKFGGTIIPHGRDTDFLNPEYFDRKTLRKKLGLERQNIISFIGTPRSHKGIEDLIKALGLVRQPNILLLLVGIDNTCKGQKICSLARRKIGAERTMFFGEQAITKIGVFLAVSDIIVVPQKDNWATKGQFPAKIFDAMSMAKPIISTAVNDIPQVLENCGLVVEPGDVKAIADKINFLLENKDIALKLGKRAREKCIERYSWNALEKYLFPLFDKYV